MGNGGSARSRSGSGASSNGGSARSRSGSGAGDRERASSDNIVLRAPGEQQELSDFRFGRCYGRGAFGKVHSVQRKADKAWFAAKAIDIKNAIDRDPKLTSMASEVTILATLALKQHHPFISNLHCGMVEKDVMYLVMDLSNAGSFEDFLTHTAKDMHLPEKSCKFYTGNLLLALQHLHKHHIIHRDVKPDNLLLTDNGYLKISDFGISAKLNEKTTTTSMKSGTIPYMAPEMFCTISRHTYMVDIYAAGIVLFELLYKKVPYERGLRQAGPFVDKAKQTKPTQAPPGYELRFADLHVTKSKPTEECQDFLNQVTHIYPWQRIGSNDGVKQVLDHTFFKDLDCEALLAQTLEAPILPDVNGQAVHQQGEDVLDLFEDGGKKEELSEKQLATVRTLEAKLKEVSKMQ